MWQNIASNEDLVRRNLKLMKLDDRMLTASQIQDIVRIVKEFVPQYNKIKFWKTYIDLELEGIDVDNLCNNFHFLIHSANV
jgi:hypothetical protein